MTIGEALYDHYEKTMKQIAAVLKKRGYNMVTKGIE